MSRQHKPKRNKRKSSEPQNQLLSPSPKPSSHQLERLHLLVEDRLNKERVNSEELIMRLSTKFQSTNDLIKHIMLVMLVTESFFATKRPLYLRYNDEDFLMDFLMDFLEEGNIEHLISDNQFTTSLFTDTHLIDMLLTNKLLIEKVFEYIFDPIKVDIRLIDDTHAAADEEAIMPFEIEIEE